MAAMGGRLVCAGAWTRRVMRGVCTAVGGNHTSPALQHSCCLLQAAVMLSVGASCLASCALKPHFSLSSPSRVPPLLQVITVNIYRSMHESFQTFDYISEAGNFGWVSREAGACQRHGVSLACKAADAVAVGHQMAAVGAAPCWWW